MVQCEKRDVTGVTSLQTVDKVGAELEVPLCLQSEETENCLLSPIHI